MSQAAADVLEKALQKIASGFMSGESAAHLATYALHQAAQARLSGQAQDPLRGMTEGMRDDGTAVRRTHAPRERGGA
jgi:hypothetical protein